MRRKDSIGRFFSKVSKGKSCWEWIGCLHEQGYGIARREGQKVLAHRLSWEIHFGKIPIGMEICHRCDNPKCVKPDHIFVGTHQDNMRDMMAKGRNADMNGEKNGNHKLNAGDIKNIRSLYTTGNYSQRELAMKFDVHQTNIGHIVRANTWMDITNA